MTVEAFSSPLFLPSFDGAKLAVYQAGPDDGPVVHAVHGFASSAILNWQSSGWVRTLVRAGYRVVAHDQRGHGASARSADHHFYTLDGLIDDARAVQDAIGVAPHMYLGYSLGARVGWRLGVEDPDRSASVYLGGMPLGNSLQGFDADAARAILAGEAESADALTETYLEMARGVAGNDPAALVALADGLRDAAPIAVEPWPERLVGVAVGENDPLVADNERIAAVSGARLTVLPGRDHISAVTSRHFKDAVLAELRRI